MPEPKKKKKEFEAQADMALNGIRIVPNQTSARRASKDSAQPDGSPDPEAGSTEPALVSKLIDFIKSM